MGRRTVEVEADAEVKAEAWVKDTDLTLKLNEQVKKKSSLVITLGLAYGSLGVIYGDIGTSLIYVFPAIFQDFNVTDFNLGSVDTDIKGAISLIFWTLTLITLVKYIGVVLAANDTGEGGTVALYALLCRTMGITPFGTMKSQDFKQILALTSASPTGPVRPKLGEHRFKENARAKRKEDRVAQIKKPAKPPIFRKSTGFRNLLILDGTNIIRWFRCNFIAQRVLLFITMLATGLIVGDGILMPAFSVVSAISGLRRSTGINNDGQIVGISIAILVVLFLFQHIGTKRIGWLFSPIVICWLSCNVGVGIYNLATYGGEIFAGLSPHYIVKFFDAHPKEAWQGLGGVLLCVTGTETMFAAMGHFSRAAVAVAFGLYVYPCLMISYLGQGAFLLRHPQEVEEAFWSSIPDNFYWPMLALATLAACVASQAAITGTFSLLRQAMALGIFPKLRVVHTGDVVEGQIFIPVINYALMALCIAVVAGFQGDSLLLADAYGVAVISVMVITTLMTVLIMVTAWETTLLVVIPFTCLYLLIEGGFLSSSLKKVPDGAWFAVVVSVTFALIMLVWWLGSLWRRRVVIQNSKASSALEMFAVSNTPSARGVQKTPRKVRDEGATVAKSAAGYAVYSDRASMEDNITIQLAEVLANQPMHNPLGRTKSATGMDKGRAMGMDRVSAPVQQQPSLGRFSASPAPGRQANLPPALSLFRMSASPAQGQAMASNNPAEKVHRMSQTQSHAIPENGVAKLHPTSHQEPFSTGRMSLEQAPPSMAPAPASLGDGSSSSAIAAEAKILEDKVVEGPEAGAHKKGEAPGVQMATAKDVDKLEKKLSIKMPKKKGVHYESSVSFQAEPGKPLALLSGLGLYYSESPVGIPEVMRHFLRNVDALHAVAIFLTVRFLPMPTVKHSERLLVKAVHGMPNFYQVVARYGYQDLVDHGDAFMCQIKATILHKLEIKAGLRMKGVSDDFIHGVEDEEVEEGGGHGGGRISSVRAVLSGGNHPFGLPTVTETEIERYTKERLNHDIGIRGSRIDLSEGMAMMSQFADGALDGLAEAAVAPNASACAVAAYEAACALSDAFDEGVVYYLGRIWTRSRSTNKNPFHGIVIGTMFRTMELLSYHDSEAWQIPLDKMVELGMTVEV